MIPLPYYLIASTALLSVGIFGVLTRKHVIQILLSVELILNAVTINFVAFSLYIIPERPIGQVFAIFVITFAAAKVGGWSGYYPGYLQEP
ncbi:NADH-quinone oxidoreductase subunit K [Candidatus Hakubella thermalkaliphila]|uniref:NADH-quinone oxidoreductase subunit K n=1 Tax=Candidatus Hakubella thermalkaliphila TaxID=2754717 RepID=A0A6V8PRL2_9ACTN|nr:NADH-quinone oxidoreductase subunit NuoK [Candidatus Hakubella thermalkaliphila]GFP34720.1 NADH-quinone oxidoreductase subunit K [Candidatus Hakubella thermalkaliphila]